MLKQCQSASREKGVTCLVISSTVEMCNKGSWLDNLTSYYWVFEVKTTEHHHQYSATLHTPYLFKHSLHKRQTRNYQE